MAYPRARVLNALEAPLAAERVLVIRLGSLGDVVRTRFALPGLRALYPRARIDWLVEDRSAPGLTGVCGLDRVLEVPRARLDWRRPGRWRETMAPVLEQLRETRYDLSVDFHGVLKSALLARLAGIEQRVGYGTGFAREGSARWLTHRARVEPRHLPRFERNAALVRFLGGDDSARVPGLQLSPDAERALPPLPERFAVLHPGTSPGTEYKRWPPRRYAQVARALSDQLALRSLVSWGPVPGERETALEVVEHSAGAAELAPATASLEVLLALLRRASLFVGGDSGPVHLAALCGCPQVIVFGPTDPIENAPFPGLRSAVVHGDVGCSPCRLGCPVRSCMTELPAAHVIEAARGLLARSPAPQARPQGAC